MENNNRQLEKIDEEYRLLVEEAAEKEQNFDIPNSTLEHAVFLAQKLIEKSENNIKILTGELSSPYYDIIKGDLAQAAKKFKKSRGQIQIIIWEKDAEQSRGLLQEFISTYGDIIQIRNANQSSMIPHFLVSDSKRYRLEVTHTKEQLLKREIKGTANFNNPETAEVLNKAFDDTWRSLSPG